MTAGGMEAVQLGGRQPRAAVACHSCGDDSQQGGRLLGLMLLVVFCLPPESQLSGPCTAASEC